jgi:MoxR-like ATPase
MFESIDEAEARLRARKYFVDRESATTVFLAARLGKPLFVEGQGGVGKSSLAQAMADALGTTLFRLQCHEELGPAQAAYEWDLARQALRVKLGLESGETAREAESAAFDGEHIIKMPLLASITHEGPAAPVLLVDEIDRATEEFQGFLQMFLEDFTVVVPHVGPIRANLQPLVVVTSNDTADVSDSLKRQCLYLWLDYPDFEREREIVLANIPGIGTPLAGQICNFMDLVRREGFARPPGIAETIDWARALVALHKGELDRETVNQTLGCVFKSAEDIEHFRTKRYWERLRSTLDATG